MRFCADSQEISTFFANNSYTAAILCTKSDVFLEIDLTTLECIPELKYNTAIKKTSSDSIPGG